MLIDVIKSLILSRGAQLFARWIGGALTFLAGMAGVSLDSGQFTATTSCLSYLAAALVCFALDLVMHYFQNRSAKALSWASWSRDTYVHPLHLTHAARDFKTLRSMSPRKATPITYEEAKAAAIAAGIAPDQVTVQDIALFGYAVPDPTENVSPKVAQTAQQVQDDLALLQEEAKGNQWTATAIGAFGRILSFFAGHFLMAKRPKPDARILSIFALGGCLLFSGCSSQQAQRSVDSATQSVEALNQGHLDFEEAFIGYYQASEQARIDQLYQAAVASHTDANGKADVVALQAVLNQRAQLMATMAANVSAMRGKQGIILQNAANAAAYLEGLHQYFQTEAQTMVSAQALLDQVTTFLESFVGSKLNPAPTIQTAPALMPRGLRFQAR